MQLVQKLCKENLQALDGSLRWPRKTQNPKMSSQTHPEALPGCTIHERIGKSVGSHMAEPFPPPYTLHQSTSLQLHTWNGRTRTRSRRGDSWTFGKECEPQATNGACLWASFHKEDIHRLRVTIQHGQSDRVHQKPRCKTCNHVLQHKNLFAICGSFHKIDVFPLGVFRELALLEDLLF